MRHSLEVGFSFGLTSGIITTLGVVIGLSASTNSQLVVIGGILTIAFADAFSDALGIHISEESENKHTKKEIWESTLSTFFTKFFFALSFLVPVLIFPLSTAIIVCLVWGFSLLGFFSYSIARREKTPCWGVIGEHLLIAVAVIIVTYVVGEFVATNFG